VAATIDVRFLPFPNMKLSFYLILNCLLLCIFHNSCSFFFIFRQFSCLLGLGPEEQRMCVADSSVCVSL